MSGSSVSPPPATVSTSTIRAGDGPPVTGWPRRSSGCSAPSVARRTGTASGKPWLPGIAKLPTSARTSTTNRPATLVAGYDLLAVEDLQIANMLRRAKPVPDPGNPGQFLPNGARAKSGLNRSISDAGWGQFVSILRAKAEDAGRTWIEVDPRHTSDGCENCGHAAPENRVTQAEFACQRCGHTRPGRRTRRTQHPPGRTGPSRRRGVKRSWRLPAVREVTGRRRRTAVGDMNRRPKPRS